MLILILKRATRWKQSECLKMITCREAALLIWMFNQDGYISETYTSNVLTHSIFGYFITIQCNVSLTNIYAKVCAKNSWKHKNAQVNSNFESLLTFMVLIWECSLKKLVIFVWTKSVRITSPYAVNLSFLSNPNPFPSFPSQKKTTINKLLNILF